MNREPDKLLNVARALWENAMSQRGAHYKASDHLRVWHYVLGFMLILFSAIVSGSVLQATDGNPSQALTLSAGALSVAVVVLTSVQTTFKLGERSEQHKSAAVGFGKIARKLDLLISRDHEDLDKAWAELTAINDEYDSVEAGAPGFLGRTYDKARAQVQDEARARYGAG
jgi:conflict system pore-forming effector with SLATT domain